MHGEAVQCMKMAIFHYPRFKADCTFTTSFSFFTPISCLSNELFRNIEQSVRAMDPVSAFGLASGAVQIAQVVAQTIKGLVTLRGKFNNADLTILSLIGELTTIESAVIQLDNWARSNARDSPEFNDYNQGFNVALEGCRAIMDVFKEDVGALAQGTVDGTVVGFRTRAKVVWNEDIMRDHQSRLHAQVLALQLLLQACQW